MVQDERIILNFSLGTMPSICEERRKRIVYFFTRIRRTRRDWKPFTVAHFGLSGIHMSGNRGYYTSYASWTSTKVKTFGKKKFEPKVMLWISMSPEGISRAVLTSGRSMNVFSQSYVNNCFNNAVPGHPLPSGLTKPVLITQGWRQHFSTTTT